VVGAGSNDWRLIARLKFRPVSFNSSENIYIFIHGVFHDNLHRLNLIKKVVKVYRSSMKKRLTSNFSSEVYAVSLKKILLSYRSLILIQSQKLLREYYLILCYKWQMIYFYEDV